MSGLRHCRPGDDAPWDRAAAAHFLRRSGFGASRAEIEEALELGFEECLRRAFAPAGHAPALFAGIEPLLAAGEIETLQAWWMALVLANGAPLTERMALLWHDHFATSNDKVGDVRMMHRQNALFREQGLGSFRELLGSVAKDPAMLVWLDGDQNRRGRPNENFARELMELFALGIGNYGERDVQEAARAFTGWGTNGRAFADRPENHDPGAKTVLGVTGELDGDGVLELVLDHPACARHVARRLLAEFTVPEPREADVNALADLLVEADWIIAAALEAIFRSELFHSPAARRARIAGPVELVAASARTLGARVVPRDAASAAAAMGQALFRPPSVKGWDGGRSWIDAGTWIARHQFLADLAAAHGREDGRVEVDLAQAFGNPAAPRDVPGAVLATLLPDGAPEEFERILIERAAAEGDVDRALITVTALVLTAPEYQLV